MFVLAGGAVGASAGAEFDLATVDVLLELGPLVRGGVPVPCQELCIWSLPPESCTWTSNRPFWKPCWRGRHCSSARAS